MVCGVAPRRPPLLPLTPGYNRPVGAGHFIFSIYFILFSRKWVLRHSYIFFFALDKIKQNL
jgi:hypothetical protein